MTARNQAATYVAEQGKAPVDSRGPCTDQARWIIEPVSAVAREAAAILMTGDDSVQGLSIVAEHVRSNALLLALHARGLPIAYHGPALRITL